MAFRAEATDWAQTQPDRRLRVSRDLVSLVFYLTTGEWRQAVDCQRQRRRVAKLHQLAADVREEIAGQPATEREFRPLVRKMFCRAWEAVQYHLLNSKHPSGFRFSVAAASMLDTHATARADLAEVEALVTKNWEHLGLRCMRIHFARLLVDLERDAGATLQ